MKGERTMPIKASAALGNGYAAVFALAKETK